MSSPHDGCISFHPDITTSAAPNDIHDDEERQFDLDDDMIACNQNGILF